MEGSETIIIKQVKNPKIKILRLDLRCTLASKHLMLQLWNKEGVLQNHSLSALLIILNEGFHNWVPWWKGL